MTDCEKCKDYLQVSEYSATEGVWKPRWRAVSWGRLRVDLHMGGRYWYRPPYAHSPKAEGAWDEACEPSAGDHQNVETRELGERQSRMWNRDFLKPSFIWKRETAIRDLNLGGEGGCRDSLPPVSWEVWVKCEFPSRTECEVVKCTVVHVNRFFPSWADPADPQTMLPYVSYSIWSQDTCGNFFPASSKRLPWDLAGRRLQGMLLTAGTFQPRMVSQTFSF